MTDRELLELAALAAGVDLSTRKWHGRWYVSPEPNIKNWNPLTDDGDALRLAAKLKIDIEWQATNPFPEPRVEAYQRNDEGTHFCADEHEGDYRRAIVRAAAEVGKAMQQEHRRTTP
ncbi:hypothetical protein J1N44_17945 [Acidovorax temperans]|uniref:hypothetical protein n=1 Tax=Acidovorax temperans TaxID=80878 RepID=UPI001A946B23|nr:hypothetical protein [Acidovorax temperans]MBO0943540.1 hypothetical protein [Acidovorax temperans]